MSLLITQICQGLMEKIRFNLHAWIVLGSNLGNCATLDFLGMLKHHYHAHLGLYDKGHSIKGFFLPVIFGMLLLVPKNLL